MEQLYVRSSRRSSMDRDPGSPGLEKRSKKFTQLHSPIEKERTRGRYACLGHRLKHKRCPLDCPERRPKMATEATTENIVKVETPPDSPKIGATKNVLKLDDAFTISSPKLNELHKEAQKEPIVPKQENQTPIQPQWDHSHTSFEAHSWDSFGSFSSFREENFHSSILDHIKIEPKEEPHPHDEIDSWFLDDSPVTGSETMYSSDEFDSRRSSIGNSMDQLRDNLPRIIIYKDTMERWLLEPYFEALVTGCYVKIPMGNDHHIIRRIEKIVENCFNVYSINRIQTTKGLEILIDNCRQIVRLDQISNQPLTPSELHFWIDEVEKGIIHVDVEEINQKADLVKVFLGQKFPQVFPQNFPQSLDTELYIQTDWNY
eukprot:TRINITY_DN1970_c0_g1_i4.p1 TRINITY_DN1970_c0_g1~~TRINITY_DN1970_c0_g1_i4.p1  ORF type:complete len:373 (-),score=96.44 TRINITY_DN1970_c0_g1_i4:29-1147(-)